MEGAERPDAMAGAGRAGATPTTAPVAPTPPGHLAGHDQATTLAFRALLIVEVLAAGFFGLFPLALPDAFARLFAYPGAEPFLYRLAGAATTGYGVMALVASFRPRWATFRIPLIATLTFNVGAVVAALLSLDEGDSSALVSVVLLAATAFALVSAYWLYRNEGPRPSERDSIEEGFRATLIAAVAVDAIFGIVPLLMAESFVAFFGLPGSDLFIYRLAGAATLGYAAAGAFQLLSGRWAEIRLQVAGAIAFNAAAALGAAVYVAGGGASTLGLLVLVGSGFFTLAFTWWSARAAR